MMRYQKLVQEILEKAKPAGGLHSVVWVACGGSNGGFYAAHYFLTRESKTLNSQMMTSNEFNLAPPACCGENCLVVLCSMRGTPETCRAAHTASSMGAQTVALYVQESDLTLYSDHAIPYESIAEDASRAENVNSSIALDLAAEILAAAEGYAHLDKMEEAFSMLDDIYRDACEYCVPRAEEFAGECSRDKVIYVMGSGPSMGSAYIFSICNLMEMQWVHSPTVNCGEFFHGPFETLDRTLPVFLLLSEGRTRPMDERALEFLRKYGQRIDVLDAKELGINRIADQVNEYFNHLLFSPVLNNVYLRRLAETRKHPYTHRRYMWKVAY